MNQDQRLYTPHYLPTKHSLSAGAKRKAEAPAISFETLMQQQLKRVESIGKPCQACFGRGEIDNYEDMGMTTVYAGTYTCEDCGGEG